MTVLVALSGGLGNMLFQVAAGRDLAERRDDELLALPPGSARDLRNRNRLWAALGEEIPAAPDRLVTRIERAARGRRIRRDVAIVAQKASQAFGPPSGWGTTAPLVVLRGYFQHPGFLGRQPEALAQRLWAWVEASRSGPPPSVAIHLRRGDYLLRGWELPVEQHEAAVRALMREVEGPLEVAIVSDDHLAAEGLAARLGPLGAGSGWVFRASDDRSSSADFATLAGARHLIMSNSTFSWWAAVVGDGSPSRHPGRRVLAPRVWLGTHEHDLLRPEWVAFGPDRRPEEA